MRDYLPLIFKTTIICAALFAGSFLVHDPGYVKIAYGNGFIETTIPALMAALAVLWLAEKVLVKVWGLFGWRKKRAENKLNLGLSAYVAQDWKQAEKLLSHDGPQSVPAKNLYAALAADAMEQPEKVTKHLDKISKSDVNTSLVKTELLLKQGQITPAFELIEPLYKRKPKENVRLKLYIRVVEAKQDWLELLSLLPKIQKQSLFTEEQYDKYAAKVVDNALKHTAQTNPFEAVEQQWKQLPSKLKKTHYAIASYITVLANNGKGQEAEALLVKTLKKANIDDFLPLIRNVKFGDGIALSQFLQKALKADEHNSLLLCALGHVAVGKQDYQLAAKALEKAYEENRALSEADLMVLADAYNRTSQFNKAVVVYQHFLTNHGGKTN